MKSRDVRLFQLNVNYHKKIGWRFEDFYNGGGFWHKPKCNGRSRGSTCLCGGRLLPSLDTDANLVIEELDRVFDSNWHIDRVLGKFSMAVSFKPMIRDFEGASFNEVALKALAAYVGL